MLTQLIENGRTQQYVYSSDAKFLLPGVCLKTYCTVQYMSATQFALEAYYQITRKSLFQETKGPPLYFRGYLN